MDTRAPLKFHTVLAFEGMHCHVEDVIGQGSNAIVYRGWYPDALNPELKHHVLIKELFPLHPDQKIHRGENNAIIVDPEAQDHFAMHRSSFEAGNAVHLRLLADHPERMALGGNVNSFCLNNTLYTVLGYSGGRSLQDELNRGTSDLRTIALRMIALLEALEAFHKSGYLHLDISPDNIMLCGEGNSERLFLIDYNSARTLDGWGSDYLSCKSGYSAPEVENGDERAIGFPSDLFSVAAVFFRCIMGRKLTLEEMLRAKAPDGRDSPLLSDVPQTVSAMVARILRKGLDTLPRRRYQSIGQLGQAFRELIDRIDCVGVTHWALWENGRRSVEELICRNPALRYMKEQLYPIRLEQGDTMPLSRYLDTVLSPEGRSGLILAQGGMGKTTLLLHTALLQGTRYSPASSAVFYISLSGWNGGADYIRRQILQTLRFRREENTFDSAMHKLHQLLNQTIKTKTSEIPTVLLLLDGLNEVRGDTGPLVQEINELNGFAGVRIIAASRSEIPALALETARLTALNVEDVEDALGEQGLLVPREAPVLELLRTPLILSIYIRTCQNGRQPDIHTEEELLEQYLGAMLEKELALLSEQDAEYWQMEAALTLVLPLIAGQTAKLGQSLPDAQLLKTIATCRNVIQSAPGKLNRNWIGHSGDILGNTQTPEQWYGLIVHKILWQRMGLLVREPEGRYRIFHQELEAHLAANAKDLLPLWATKRRLILTVAAAALCCIVAAGAWQYREQSDAKLEKAIEYASTGYRVSGTLYDQVRALAEYALEGNPSDFFLYYSRVMEDLNSQQTLSSTAAGYSRYLSGLEGGNLRVFWSGKDFENTLARELLNYGAEQADYYCDVLPVLAAWMESAELRQQCPDFAQCFMAAVEADADVVSELYQQVCAVHLESRTDLWADNIRAMTALLEQQEAHRLEAKTSRSPSLEDLRTALLTTRGTLANRTGRLRGYLRENLHIARQELEEVRILLAREGIDASTATLKSLEEILAGLGHYAG